MRRLRRRFQRNRSKVASGYSNSYVKPGLVERFFSIRGGAGNLPTGILAGDPGHIGHHDSIHELLGRLDNQSSFLAAGFDQGTLAARPAAAAANEGMFYFATDSPELYYSDGSSWQPLVGGGGGGGSTPFFLPQTYDATAGPAGTPAVNLAAIQLAADAAELAGGGIVYISPGTWTVASTGTITLGHGVELWGGGLGNTVLRQDNPDRVDGGGLVRGRQTSTTANVTAGSNVITVASAARMIVGDAISIEFAGPPDTVDPPGDKVLNTRIRAISGLSITLMDEASATANNVVTRHGSRGVRLRNITLDGNRPALANGAANPGPVADFITCADVVIEQCELRKAPRNAVSFRVGSDNCHAVDCVFRDNSATNNGVFTGFCIDFFQGVRRSGARGCSFLGDYNVGVLIDDRTVGATNFDDESTDNYVRDCTFQRDEGLITVPGQLYGTDVLMSGCSRNRLSGNTHRFAATPVWLCAVQGGTPLPTKANIIEGNVFEDCLENVRMGIIGTDAVEHNKIINNVARGTTPVELNSDITNRTNQVSGNSHDSETEAPMRGFSGVATEFILSSDLPAASEEMDGRLIVQGNYFQSNPTRGNTAGGVTQVFATSGIGAPQVGDLLLAFVAWTDSNTGLTATNTPVGWTKEEEVLQPAGVNRAQGTLFSRISDGSEVNLSVTFLAGNANNAVTLQVLRFPVAAISGAPIDGSSTTPTSLVTTSLSINGVTTAQPGTQVFYFASAAAPSERRFACSVRELWDFGQPLTQAVSQAGQVKTQAVAGPSGNEAVLIAATANISGIAVGVAPAVPVSDDSQGPIQLVYYGGGQRYRLRGELL